MCGRFTYAKEFREIRIRFDLDRDIPLFRPRYNIAPGQDVPVDNGPGTIPDSATQRPLAICGMGMLMALVGSLVGLTLMAVSRRRRR